MKGYNTLYYLLFVALITGTLAAIAQNSYGIKILGAVSIAFAILFLIQFINSFTQKTKRNIYSSLELGCLFILSVIFVLRVFYISFYYAELLFVLASLILIALYFRKMLETVRTMQSKNIFLSVLICLFYLAIIFYFISLSSINFQQQFSQVAGIIAFGILIAFIACSVIKPDLFLEGQRVAAFRLLAKKKDNAVLILSLFLLFTLYKGFTMTGMLPKIYSDEYPQQYFELINKAESGKELPVQGKYKYQKFKEGYENFVKQSQ